jgi:hypothetical protein
MMHELHKILYGSIDCAQQPPGRRVSSIFKQSDIRQNIPDEDKIIAYLSAEGSATLREISMALGASQRMAKAILNQMHNDDLIVAVLGSGDCDPLEYSLSSTV